MDLWFDVQLLCKDAGISSAVSCIKRLSVCELKFLFNLERLSYSKGLFLRNSV